MENTERVVEAEVVSSPSKAQKISHSSLLSNTTGKVFFFLKVLERYFWCPTASRN